jgi:signal transduction histidine kinase
MRSGVASLPRRLGSNVRVRVTATAILGVAGVLALAAAVLAAGLHHDRQKVMMATASEQAQEVVSFNPELKPPLVLPLKATVQSGLLQVVKDGRVLGSSHALRQLGPLWTPGRPTVQAVPAGLEDVAPDASVVAVGVGSGNGHATVVVVISMQQYDHSVSLVVTLLEWTIGALVVLLGLICWFVVGRALRPIEMMRREVAEVATVREVHRVAEPAGDDEVAGLARTLNSMLDRIQASTERERRFVADASHELRSPIANIRTELEVALHNSDITDWSEVAGEVLGQNERMERLVAGLLLLARSDEGSLIEATEPTDLVEVIADLIAGLPDRPPVQVEVASGARSTGVKVPRVYLERLVANLVDNARRFAASSVTLSVSTPAGYVELRVRDDGPGVPEADRYRICERFVRLDEARHRGEGGFGLGLAIVADLSRFYRGTIQVGPGEPGAEFVLRLPAAYREAQAARAAGWMTEADSSIGPADSASIEVH